MEALHTKGAPVPWEMFELWLCRDVYHCSPGELGRQDAEQVMAHLEAMAGEAVARRLSKGGR